MESVDTSGTRGVQPEVEGGREGRRRKREEGRKEQEVNGEKKDT
jgi:hypothetical protein